MTHQPGRELDALIAEKVMGWVSIPHPEPENLFPGVRAGARSWFPPNNDYAYWRERFGPGYANGVSFPEYSTSIEAAWEVVEKMGENRLRLDLSVGTSEDAIAEFSRNGSEGIEANGEDAPHAICLAALKAVGYEGNV